MDSRILQELYEMYGLEIRRYLYGLSGNHALAEELCQETFFKALLSLPDGHANMRAWLYMVARNLYFNYWKKEKRFLTLPEGMEVPEGTQHLKKQGTGRQGTQEELECQPDVLEQIVDREREEVLREALLTLSPQKREILMMQYFGRMKLKEIAEVLAISPENTRVLAHRAKQELKKYMEVQGV